MNKNFLSVLLVFLSFLVGAQSMGAEAPQMADAFRQDGKIYVVITVLGLIFASIVFFLIYIERAINKIENKLNDKS